MVHTSLALFGFGVHFNIVHVSLCVCVCVCVSSEDYKQRRVSYIFNSSEWIHTSRYHVVYITVHGDKKIKLELLLAYSAKRTTVLFLFGEGRNEYAGLV